MLYRSDEGIYERIDDYPYETLDDNQVQHKGEDTAIVRGADDIAKESCPAYSATTAPGIYYTVILTLSFTLIFNCHHKSTVLSPNERDNDEQENEEYVNMQ